MAYSKSNEKDNTLSTSTTGPKPPPYKVGYTVSGSGAVGSGSSHLSLPEEAGAHVFQNRGFTALEGADEALNAGARLAVKQTQLYAEAEATEAIGVGLESIEKQNKVSNYY